VSGTRTPPLASRVLTESKAKNPIDRFVLVAIATHYGKNDCAWPSYDMLKDETHYSVRTIKRSILRLQGKGDDDDRLEVPELRVELHGGHVAGRPRQYQPNAYTITLSGASVVTTSGDYWDTTSGDRDAFSGDRDGNSVVTAVAYRTTREPQLRTADVASLRRAVFLQVDHHHGDEDDCFSAWLRANVNPSQHEAALGYRREALAVSS